MAEEGEMESITANALNTGGETGALMEVKFQKKPDQTQKYLEAEPKALGVTQIMLSLYIMGTIFCHLNTDVDLTLTLILNPICSSANIIAGSVAIAAQNLDLTTLKACLGMQLVACVMSVISFLNSLGNAEGYDVFHICWESYLNGTSQTDMCERLLAIYQPLNGTECLMQVTQIALSATLAAFCCKVIQCCSPRTSVPVVVVNAPPGPQ
ncbi:uncharacterized protein LOC132894494 [Neoarius graeffei]|uniref:uncharacterized protein LOC132894494 n=1 Tax=Neoarius graeffei TaxID=443677 RepID=UPI00298C6CF9|nr:uncharacterized protein LOC132894494 [Neoarius graeffei]